MNSLRLILATIALLVATSQSSRAADAPASIEIGSFKQIGDQPNRSWIGPAVRESLSAEASRWGLKLDTPVQISGSFQTVESQVRIDAYIDDAAGHPLAGVTSRGRVEDLFAMEDELAEQMRRALRELTYRGVTTTSPAAARPKLPGPDAKSFEAAFTGPVRIKSAYARPTDWLDPNARAARYRYFYSVPWYSGYGGAYYGGGFFGLGYGWSGGFTHGPTGVAWQGEY